MPEALLLGCPKCGNIGRCIESRTRTDGARRRRLKCPACDHRWTQIEGGPPGSELPSTRRKLNADQIRAILSSPLGYVKLARQYGVTQSVIVRIKKGITYKELSSGLGPSCSDCEHWSGSCAFGFPEAGSTFAQECSLYTPST